MSPGRITVQGMMPEIFLPGPARPSTAPARILSRFAHCESERALSSVCGSSSTTRLGRTVLPSGRLNFIPRMRPVRPATLIIAPLALLPSIVGRRLLLRSIRSACVCLCRADHLRAIRDSIEGLIGKQTSGKSAKSSSLLSSSVLIESSISHACPSSLPIKHTKLR